MKSLQLALLLCGVFVLSSCATKYAQRGGWPDMYGYSDSPIDANTYQVTFAGNGSTPPEVVDRYALYRAAELTVQQGFDYFVVIDAQHSENQNSTTTAMPTDHHTKIQHEMDPQTGQMVPVAITHEDYQSTTTTTTDHTITKTVRMFKGSRPPDNANAYDAKSMLSVMGPTINR